MLDALFYSPTRHRMVRGVEKVSDFFAQENILS